MSEIVYAVYGNRVESEVVAKRTAKQVWFAKRAGLAFGCVTVLPADDWRLSPTPAHAIRAAINRHAENIAAMMRDINNERSRIGVLQQMLAEEIAKDQPHEAHPTHPQDSDEADGNQAEAAEGG